MRDAEGVQFLQWCLPRLRLRWRGYRKVRRQVYRRIDRRLHALGLADVAAYRAHLERRPEEWAVLDGLCRISISRFYRDRAVFEYLEREVLPHLAGMAMTAGVPHLRCWSIGCASGEEPYTLAILWRGRLAPRFPGLALRLLATDADPEAIERAKSGCYPPGSVKDLPADLLTAAFVRSAEGLCVKTDYRDGVEFLEQDMRVTIAQEEFHLILCRNVAFTYFDATLQHDALLTILDRLHPGGALVIGSTESLPEDGSTLEPWSARLGVYRSPQPSQGTRSPSLNNPWHGQKLRSLPSPSRGFG